MSESSDAEQVRSAKATYLDLGARRAALIRDLSSDETAPTGWSDIAELDLLERQEIAARDAWLAHAPTAPASWWPGGWRLRLPGGTIRRREGVGDLGVWRTRDDAEHYLAEHTTPDGTLPARLRGAQPEWCATREDPHTLHGVNRDPIALDLDFWTP